MSASTTARAFVSEQTCGACAANISAGNHNLCPACEKYVGQDYVSRRELPLPEHELQAVAARLREDKAPAHDSPEELGRFEMFLRRAKLSDREKDVIHMRFVESLNFFSISKKLGISMNSVFSYYRRGLKKAKMCHENLPMVGSRDSKPVSTLEKRSFQKAQGSVGGPKLCPVRILRPDAKGVLQLTQVIGVSKLVVAQQTQGQRSHPRDHYPKNCPRCSGVLLRPRGQAPYCADCLWVPEFHE